MKVRGVRGTVRLGLRLAQWQVGPSGAIGTAATAWKAGRVLARTDADEMRVRVTDLAWLVERRMGQHHPNAVHLRLTLRLVDRVLKSTAGR